MPSWTPRLPISWVTGTAAHPQEPESLSPVRLQVAEKAGDNGEAGPALVSPATAQQFGLAAGRRGFVCLAEGSDCVLAVAADAGVPDGQIAVTAVQRVNLHLGSGNYEEFRVFVPPAGQPFELVDLEAEVTLFDGAEGEPAVQVDARELSRELLRSCHGLVLALNEVVVLSLGGTRLVLRVTATNTLERQAQEEELGYHCYRGLLTHDTDMFLHTCDQPAGGKQEEQQQHEQQQQAAAALRTEAGRESECRGSSSGSGSASEEGEEAVPLPQSRAAAHSGVTLLNARQRPASGPSLSCISVHTSDGECFPVHRRLLRPCIALTRAVRAEEGEGGAAPEVTVDVDTLTFDRVLIFLEALALGRQTPAFGLHLCPPLLAAAQHLGLRPLEEYCLARQGESQSRLRWYTFEEVKALNGAGGCWLVLDGMVLDVTRWLPEHPGGSKIIPAQSLNLDCSRLFEIYHASREGFIYLRHFYEGEILPEDRALVPAPSPAPGTAFLQQLREYTPWRMQAPEAATHLGAKRVSKTPKTFACKSNS